MKSYRWVLIFFAIIFSLSAISSNIDQDVWESRTYPVGDFREIRLDGSFKVFLSQGRSNSITVKVSDEKAFEYLHINTQGGVLNIDVDRKPFDFSKVQIYITLRELKKLEIEGGITMETDGYLDLKNISVHVKGGAKINFLVKVQNMVIISEGGALFALSGVAESLDVRLYGAGHVNAREMKTGDIEFRIEGVGTGIVYATNYLNAVIKGAGKLKYRGNPRIIKNIEGLGSVVSE